MVLTAATFAYFCAVGITLPVLPRYVKDGLGQSKTVVGFVAGVYSASAIMCRPLIGWFASRYGRRTMILVGAIVGAVALAAHPLGRSLVGLYVARFVAGVAEAMVFVGVATEVSEMAPPSRRAEATSYNSVGVFFALGIGPLIGDRFASEGKLALPFALSGVIGVVAFAIAMALPRDEPPPTRARRARPPIFHRGGLWTGAVLGLAMVGYFGWTTYLPLRADEVPGASAGSMYLVYSVMVLIFRLFGARIPERIGLGRCTAVAVSTMGVALLTMAAVGGLVGLWAGVVLVAVAISLMYPALLALTVNRYDDEHDRAAVVSTFTMFFEVGGLLGGVVLGPVADATSYRGAFAVGGGIALVAAVVLWFGVLAPRRALSRA